MSRRKFLKTSALGIGGILLAQCTSGAEEQNVVEEKISIINLRNVEELVSTK